MAVVVENVTFSVKVALTMLRGVGFWAPGIMDEDQKLLYRCRAFFTFMFVLGIYIIIQVVDLFRVWGDLPLMTGTAFLLFTNLAQVAKIVNILYKRQRIQHIIDDCDLVLREATSGAARIIVTRCDKETKLQLGIYTLLTIFTLTGWATSAEQGRLPMRAWYPYDTSKSPLYELTYIHQVVAIFVAASLNVCKDILVVSLIAQCRCRLQLLQMQLRTLCRGLKVDQRGLYPADQEAIARSRLHACVKRHQAALETASALQACFSAPIFAQFTVSLIIICVTAFQLFSQKGNLVRLLSMGTYLLNMMFQVFIYCYQGHHLTEESVEVAGAAYSCLWYACGTRLRRELLLVMSRTGRGARITAGGFTALALTSFMAIIKASYSLFTLLQQVNENR